MQPDQQQARSVAVAYRRHAATYRLLAETSRNVAKVMNDAIYRGDITPFYRQCRDRHLVHAEEYAAKVAELHALADQLDAVSPRLHLVRPRAERDVLKLSTDHRPWPPQE